MLLFALQHVAACRQFPIQTAGLGKEPLPFPNGIGIQWRPWQPCCRAACSFCIGFSFFEIGLTWHNSGGCQPDALFCGLKELTMPLDIIACASPLLGNAGALACNGGWVECIRSGYGSLEVLPQRYYLIHCSRSVVSIRRRRRRPAVLAGGGVAAVSVSSCPFRSASLRSAVRVVSVSFAVRHVCSSC